MLFQRLYNWIKYKTLPPSVLFKNRLFIERDTKHKRIFNNFGLTFRNSKWSNYEMYNVKLHFQWSYIKYLLWLVFFFVAYVVLAKFSKYYIYFYLFNNLAFLFWVSIDTVDYYLSFILWMVTALISVITNVVYSYFFFNNFSNTTNNRQYFSNPFFYNAKMLAETTEKETSVSKHDYSWILYSWLTNLNSTKHNDTLENLFNRHVNLKWWNEYYDFFIKLYKLSYLCNLTNENYTIYSLNYSITNLKNKEYSGNYGTLISYLYRSNLLKQYPSLTISYILTRYKNYFTDRSTLNNSLYLLDTKNEWNLFNISNELVKNNHLVKSKIGLFFFEDLTFSKLTTFTTKFEELWTVNLYLKNQLNTAKWNRWLYRYSILHRKILKNSHKITITKKLLNSGFYNNTLFSKNIWASENFKRFAEDSNYFNNTTLLYYNNLFNPIKHSESLLSSNLVTNDFLSKNKLTLLSFYENSYFWFIKRFYSFNLIPNNSIKSSLTLNTFENSNVFKGVKYKNNELNKYFVFLSYILKSRSLNLNPFYLEKFTSDTCTDTSTTLGTTPSSFNLKDTYNLFNDNDFLDQDNLNLLYWITTTSSNQNLKSVFFDYTNLVTVFETGNLPICFGKESCDNENVLNYWFAKSFFSADNLYFKDIYYFTLFY